jgi:hypothetical protein
MMTGSLGSELQDVRRICVPHDPTVHTLPYMCQLAEYTVLREIRTILFIEHKWGCLLRTVHTDRSVHQNP